MITFHRLLTKKLEMSKCFNIYFQFILQSYTPINAIILTSVEEDTDSTDTRSESSSSESMNDTDM